MQQKTLSSAQIFTVVALAVAVLVGGALFLKKNRTKNWKTYTDPASGISFKHPLGWKGAALTQVFSPDKKVIAMMSGHDLRDPQSGVFVSLYTANFPGTAASTLLNKEPIHQNWNKEQFAKAMGVNPDDVFILKNLSPHATLVGIYEHRICPPTLRLAVLRPLHGAYPNFEVDIHQHFEEDRDIMAAQKSMQDKGLDPCSKAPYKQMAVQETLAANALALPYRQLIPSIIAGRYSSVLEKKIETAVEIADSVEETK